MNPRISPEHLALLGTMSDADLGRLAGVSRVAICYRRQERGIPSFIPERRGKVPVVVHLSPEELAAVERWREAHGGTREQGVKALVL